MCSEFSPPFCFHISNQEIQVPFKCLQQQWHLIPDIFYRLLISHYAQVLKSEYILLNCC